MGWKEQLLTWLNSDAGQALLAGALGGVVRWRVKGESWREAGITITVGAICALYLGPLALPLLENTVGIVVTGGDLAGLSAFIVGLGGMSISGMIIWAFDKRATGQKTEGEQ